MFAAFNPALYMTNRVPVLKNRTKDFFLMVEKLNESPSIVILTVGGRGSGKTGKLFKLLRIFGDSLRDCVFVFFNAPVTFIEKIKKYAPNEFSKRVFNIHRLRELSTIKSEHKNVIFCYDEGQRDLNAKDALKKSSRRLEKAVAISRQQNLTLIYNTQIQNVTKNMRQMTDITFYKYNNGNAIKESDNDFAKMYAKKIKKLALMKQRSLFESYYEKFIDEKGNLIEKGFIDVELFEYIPWWNESISKAYEDVNLDSEFDDFLEEDKLIVQVADLFEEKFKGMDFSKIKTSEVRGWLRKNHQELYYDVQDHIQAVVDELNARNLEDRFKKKEEKDKQQKTGSDTDKKITFAPGDDFPTFLGKNVESKFKNIAELWAKGNSNRDIYPCEKILSEYQVNEFLKTIRREETGYLFEKWFALRIDNAQGPTGGNQKDVPDYIDANGNIYSLKCQDNSKSTTPFLVEKDCSPELKEATKQCKTFKLVLYNPKWNPKMRFVEIDPKNYVNNVSLSRDKKEQFLEVIASSSNAQSPSPDPKKDLASEIDELDDLDLDDVEDIEDSDESYNSNENSTDKTETEVN